MKKPLDIAKINRILSMVADSQSFRIDNGALLDGYDDMLDTLEIENTPAAANTVVLSFSEIDDEGHLFEYDFTAQQLSDAFYASPEDKHLTIPGDHGGESFKFVAYGVGLIKTNLLDEPAASQDKPSILLITTNDAKDQAYALNLGEGYELMLSIDHGNDDDPQDIASNFVSMFKKMDIQVIEVEVDLADLPQADIDSWNWDVVLAQSIRQLALNNNADPLASESNSLSKDMSL